MKKSMQRVLAVLSVVAVLFSLTTAFAAQPPVDHPNWTYIEDAECYCYVSGGTVYAEGYVQGDSRVTKSQITLTIQRQSGSSWVNVTSDTNLEYDNYAELDLTASAISGATYRAKASVKVWFSSGTESTTVTSN